MAVAGLRSRSVSTRRQTRCPRAALCWRPGGRRRQVTGLLPDVCSRRMSKPKKPPVENSNAELQRLANRLATMVASELPPHHSATLTIHGPGNPNDLVRNASATAVRHAKPQLLEAPTPTPEQTE